MTILRVYQKQKEKLVEYTQHKYQDLSFQKAQDIITAINRVGYVAHVEPQ